MMKNQFVRHPPATVRSSMRPTGTTGSRATFSSTVTNAQNSTAENGSAVSANGCIHGTMLPPELRPIKKITSVAINNEDPRKSTRSSRDCPSSISGFSTCIYIITTEARVNGSCTRNASLQSQTSLRNPSKTSPRPLPRLQHTLLIPCHRLRLQGEIRSLEDHWRRWWK